MVSKNKFRQLALFFPETTEAPHFERNSFRVKGKIFATLDSKNKQACLKLSEIDQNVFSTAGPSIIHAVGNKWGKQGWTFVNLARVGIELFKDALTCAYCEVAPISLSADLRSDKEFAKPVIPSKNKKTATMDQSALNAKQFICDLVLQSKKSPADNSKYFRGMDKTNKVLGIRMSALFALAKQYKQMSMKEIEKLLGNNYYEARMGAVSIMDFQARDKKITPERQKQLFDLYTKRHDRINNWDLVDRGAPYIVGGWLHNKPRTILYKLAKSKNIWERRTAIVSTYYFIRQNEIDDTFKIAELLVNDKEELINMAVGGWIREAGKRDQKRLTNFLDKYAASMPRITLRLAVEKFDKKLKDHYMKLKSA